MKIVIMTQVLENYGAHDWDGKGECPSYWKPKGGSNYVVTGVTVAEAFSVDFWNEIYSLITTETESFSEAIISEKLVDDVDYSESEFFDSWETVNYISHDNAGNWTSKSTESGDQLSTYNRGIVQIERIMAIEVDKADKLISLLYTMEDGSVLESEEAAKWLAADKVA